MLGVILTLLASSMSEPYDDLVKESWSGRDPTTMLVTNEFACGEKKFSLSYGYNSTTRAMTNPNRFIESRTSLELFSFETEAFEVTDELLEDLQNAISNFHRLKFVKYLCGQRIDDQEQDFLELEFVGLHKGDHAPYRDKCMEGDGVFSRDDTSRKYIISDGKFYYRNKNGRLGRCVYGQEYFQMTIPLQLDEESGE